MMKLQLLGMFVWSFTALAQGPLALVADFRGMVSKSKLVPVSEQAFCYDQGEVAGHQVDKLQRIASVTKLLTTYFASQTLNLEKTYTTKIYIAGDRLHIEGGRDPYFEEEKLLLLMQSLNQMNYKTFKSVTFDSSFIFSDVALGEHKEITSAHTRERLNFYLKSKNLKSIRAKWSSVNKFAQEEGVLLESVLVPSLNVSQVVLSDINPLLSDSPRIFVHNSRPLRKILKSMNVMSKNMVAQHIFLESSQVRSFDSLMDSLGIAKSTYRLYNGSGLPIKTANSRKDNLATCRMVLKVISSLNSALTKNHIPLSDIVAVNGGKDLGSFRERFLKFPETHESVISKTGTLMNASALAGVLMMDGPIPFAIFNHTSSSASARSFQDHFVARMFHHLGDPTPIIYEKISIFPWEGEDFLVELN